LFIELRKDSGKPICRPRKPPAQSNKTVTSEEFLQPKPLERRLRVAFPRQVEIATELSEGRFR
jgi:hypothetical protein